MRYTLLELVQRVLESMESDEISTVGETPESLSVANIVKECYFDIIGKLHPDETEGLFKLDASGDNTKPCLMTIPSTVSKIDWLKYNISGDSTNPQYQLLRWVPIDEFLYYQTSIDPTDTDSGSMTVSLNSTNYVFKFKTDRYPTCYTIADEYNVLFDSYDSTNEATLTQVNSLGFGQLVPGFSLEDSWTPDLDPRQFQYLLQEAKSTAFIELKQTENKKAEAKARKNEILMQKTRDDNSPYASSQKRVGFGRRRVTNSMQTAMRNGK